MAWEQLTDGYSRTARLSPALLVTLPLSVLVVTLLPAALSWWGKGFALLAASGLPFAIMQFVRDRGRHVEAGLFNSWGGAPTTVMLRWSGPEPRSTVSRRHDLLSRLIDLQMPTEQEERASPAEADAVYSIATAALRELTRDGTRFSLLRHELAAYGFRRNCFGCRGLGLAVAVITAVATIILAKSGVVTLGWQVLVVLITFDCLWAAGWWYICTRDWVRWAGENYARQLFASLEILARSD